MSALRLRKRTSPPRLANFEKPNPGGSLVTAFRWRLRSPPNRSVRATPYGKLYVRPRLIPRPAFTVAIEGTVKLVTPDFMPRAGSDLIPRRIFLYRIFFGHELARELELLPVAQGMQSYFRRAV